MKRRAEFIGFLIVAVAVHGILLHQTTTGAPLAAGGRAAPATLVMGADDGIADLVEEWEAEPEHADAAELQPDERPADESRAEIDEASDDAVPEYVASAADVPDDLDKPVDLAALTHDAARPDVKPPSEVSLSKPAEDLATPVSKAMPTQPARHAPSLDQPIAPADASRPRIPPTDLEPALKIASAPTATAMPNVPADISPDALNPTVEVPREVVTRQPDDMTPRLPTRQPAAAPSWPDAMAPDVPDALTPDPSLRDPILPADTMAMARPAALPQPTPAPSPSAGVDRPRIPPTDAEPETGPAPIRASLPKAKPDRPRTRPTERKTAARKTPAKPEKPTKPPARASAAADGERREDANAPTEGAGGAAETDAMETAAIISAQKAYISAVRRAVSRKKRYPRSAQRRRVEGVAVLSITLDARGRLVRATLASSSGATVLDDAALAAARAVNRYPEIPGELGKSQLTIKLPLRFQRK